MLETDRVWESERHRETKNERQRESLIECD